MKLITTRSQIREVVDRWFNQYPKDKSGIGEKLKKLDLEAATPKDVASIIGNPSWVTTQICKECGLPSDVVVQLGEEPGYESDTTQICPKCLENAVALVEDMKGTK